MTPEEGRELAQIARRSRQPIRMRRGAVVMASAQHQPVGLIAKLMQVSESPRPNAYFQSIRARTACAA